MTEALAGQSAQVTRIVRLPDVKERLANVGFEIVGSTPGDFAKLIREEIVKWSRLIREAGIPGK